jgi:DNA-binding MarR family transcriptional regulator
VQATTATTQAADAVLADQLAGFVGYVQQTFGRDVMQLAAEFDLSFSQMKALNALRHVPEPLSVKDLGDRLGLSDAAMSRGADALVQRGLVDRIEDPQDRRVKRLSLTDAGHDLAQKLVQLRMARISDFVASLSPKERALLGKALDPIMARTDIVTFCGGRK